MPEHENTQEAAGQRQRALFIKKSTRVAASYLRRAESFPDAPESIAPFFQVLRKVYVDLSDVPETRGQKTIGSFCVMAPDELIYAAGGVPVRLCSGNYTAYSIGDDFVPRDACPLVKAVVGSCRMGLPDVYQNCALMILPVTCDCKKKLAGMLARLRPTAILHVPPSKAEDADTEQYLQELYRLIPILEETTGSRVTSETLAQGIRQVGRAQYEMSRFLAYRKDGPALLYGTQALAVMNAYAYMPAAHWARQMHRLNEELSLRLKQKQFVDQGRKPRILLTGSPIAFPNLKLPLLIEEMGGLLVGDETCMGERSLYDPAAVIDQSFDGMMRALANRYIRPCTCPTFADNRQRAHRVKQLIRERGAQGVVYHVLRGCLVYDYEYQWLEEELGKQDIPVIRVESDYNEEDVEQLRIRIEAFVEMIKLKDYNQKRKEKR